MRTHTQKIVISSLFAALTCVATMLIKIPSPLKGYLNLGDCIVLLSGWLLPPVYGFFAAGVGSMLADMFSGYMIYALPTFIIKGLMAVLAYQGYRILRQKRSSSSARILSGATAEVLMILGYLLFESILYGFAASLVNIPANAVQGVAGLLLGLLLTNMFEKQNIFQFTK